MNVKDRLLKFIAYLNLKPGSFEKKVGLGNAYVQNIRQSISIDVLDKILSVYPELNKCWLFFGDGEMILKEDDGNVNTTRFTELKTAIAEAKRQLTIAEEALGISSFESDRASADDHKTIQVVKPGSGGLLGNSEPPSAPPKTAKGKRKDSESHKNS